MNIDKARFLFLTTTLAASSVVAVAAAATGCSSTTVNNTADGSTTVVTDSGQTTTPDASDAAAEGGACLASTGPAPVCFNDDDAGADGNDLDAGDSGAVVVTQQAHCLDQCGNVKSFFKNDVAKSISTCLDNAVPDPTVEGACAEAAPACGDTAVNKACDDSAADAYCTTLLATCGSTGGVTPATQASCVHVARALSENGRTELKDCVAQDQLHDCSGCIELLVSAGGEGQ